MAPDASSLAERLRLARGCGDVAVVRLETPASLGETLQQLTRAAGLRPVGHSWRPLSADVTTGRLADALQWNLATGERVLDPARADDHAGALVDALPDGDWFATSGARALDPAWLASNHETIELGFAVVAGDEAAIVVVRGGKHAARFLPEGADLMERIRDARQCGDVNLAVVEAGSVDRHQLLWAAGLSDGCDRDIGEAEARSLLADALGRDLAYDQPILEPSRAVAFVDELFALLQGDRRFFTNRSGNSWTPVTVATFDVAVQIVTPARCGVLAIMDED